MMVQTSTIQAVGFPKPTEVSGLRSIAHLFGSSKRRCGIYLLILPGDLYYIGKSINVVQRFSSHLRKHERIQGFAFLPTARHRLDEREKEMIFRAERANLMLKNVVHATDTVGEADLEELLSAATLEQWLSDPRGRNRNDCTTTPIVLPKSHLARYEPNLRRMQEHLLFRAAVLQLFLYLEAAVPYPRTTEYSFWSVSCMPSTYRRGQPCLLCVSAGLMEVFCVGYHKDPLAKSATWGLMNVASDVLFSTFGGEKGFADTYPNVETWRSDYVAGGQHQLTLWTASQNDMIALLTDAAVTRAAAALCLRLMRKRSNFFFKFHCPQLVDAALRFRASSAEQLAAELAAVSLPADGSPPAALRADRGSAVTDKLKTPSNTTDDDTAMEKHTGERKRSEKDFATERVGADPRVRPVASSAPPPAPPPVDVAAFRRRVHASLRNLGGHGTPAAVSAVEALVKEIRPYVAARQGRAALTLLSAALGFLADPFEAIDDADGAYSDSLCQVGELLAQAAYCPDVTPQDRSQWRTNARAALARLDDYGCGNMLEAGLLPPRRV